MFDVIAYDASNIIEEQDDEPYHSCQVECSEEIPVPMTSSARSGCPAALSKPAWKAFSISMPSHDDVPLNTVRRFSPFSCQFMPHFCLIHADSACI